ncbi:protein BAT5, putative [Pediculus humanus corporis]|uniref:Protein BAT5, putative n=1 Tax=Pediculus humanus subsp. corporis TaxID=121224 RepID=E0VXH4_PEDHC|nr:protein BAT5, putative [Pediculus humanus corporis]EEB18080.1 protein BAT5, putative [Pediculus humanus corporis]
MAAIRQIWEFMFSPSLYSIYRDGSIQTMYEMNGFEKFGGQIIHSFIILWNIGLYTSPLIATICYKKGYIVFESLALVTKILIGIGVILSSSYCIKGLGRLNNPTYVKFYQVLTQAKKSLNKDTKKALMKYDFEFSEWPVEFRWSRFYAESPTSRSSAYDTITSIPCQVLSFLAAKTFGIKMVYPGSIRTLQYFMFSVILRGRGKLIVDYNAERFKLRTRDDNDIDTIVIDRRGKTPNGNTLVICCEGNAGFYELGIAMTPIEGNYSVLGWNHPGFGGSTGIPFPSQEQNAIDCVMQFSINHLKFSPDNIVLFGWSIGGYSASWAAMNYPDVKGVILDATFDDILPLAIPRMPQSWEPLVKRTIRGYINLNPCEQLTKYNGPVTFIRRTEDEIICTEQGNLSTNRGNHLVSKFLKYRYPKIFDDKRQKILNEWLASENIQQVDKENCSILLYSYITENSSSYPIQLGEEFSDEQKNHMTLYLVDMYLKSYRSTHCTPLPVSLFRIPQTPSSDTGFVKL